MTILAKLISLPISVILLVWMLRIKKDKPFPKSTVVVMIIGGFLSTIVASVGTILIALLDAMIKIGPSNLSALFSNPELIHDESFLAEINELAGPPSFLGVAFSTFIVVALVEEGAKYLVMRTCLRKPGAMECQMDAVVCGAIVGLVFQILEDLMYADNGIITAIFRAVTPYHFVFGAIMGYYYGKAAMTGRKSDRVKALLIPVLVHGLFDCSIQSLSLDDVYLLLTAVVFLFMCVLTVCMIVKIRKWSKNGTLSEPFHAPEAAEEKTEETITE